MIAFSIVAAGAVVATLQSGTGGTALTGAMTMATGISIVSPDAPFGEFESAAATLLNLHLSAAVQVSGWLVWCTAS